MPGDLSGCLRASEALEPPDLAFSYRLCQTIEVSACFTRLGHSG